MVRRPTSCPLDLSHRNVEPVPLRGLEDFLHGLPLDVRGLAANLARRIQRMDDAIDCTASEQSLSWNLGSDALCRLELAEAGLQGGVPGGSHCSIATTREAESFLERVLAHFVDLIDAGPGSEDPDSGGGDSHRPDVLLTPEELAAFEQFG